MIIDLKEPRRTGTIPKLYTFCIGKEVYMIDEKMHEAEVSLYIARYFIINRLTIEDVFVAIDGAHVKTGRDMQFDIKGFLRNSGVVKTDQDLDRWQGTYRIADYLPSIIIHSKPGIGDVKIKTIDGKTIYVESKKGDLTRRRGQEYPLMREAIGQLMTSTELGKNIIPVVAVPYTEKSYSLASVWSQYSQIKLIGIQFMLINKNGNVITICGNNILLEKSISLK
jgi:hypothetical protein